MLHQIVCSASRARLIRRADGKTTKHLRSEPLRHSLQHLPPSLVLKIHSGENYATCLVSLLLPSPVFLCLLLDFFPGRSRFLESQGQLRLEPSGAGSLDIAALPLAIIHIFLFFSSLCSNFLPLFTSCSLHLTNPGWPIRFSVTTFPMFDLQSWRCLSKSKALFTEVQVTELQSSVWTTVVLHCAENTAN